MFKCISRYMEVKILSESQTPSQGQRWIGGKKKADVIYNLFYNSHLRTQYIQ